MLRIFRRASELDFVKLKAVYRQTNALSAKKLYPREEPSLARFWAEDAFEQYIREGFFPTSGAYYAVWEEDDRYLSALRMELYRDGYLLSSLETDSDHRREGYGEKLVRAVTLEVEKPVYAHVYKNNAASMALHQKCGFQMISDCAALLDGTVTQRACTMCLK